MTDKSKEERFDEVFQIVLIVVAFSFDILWTSGRFPIAEIAVFIYVLSFWAYGNLKGGAWEYPLKLSSFNLSITLMTNFYVVGVFGDLGHLDLWGILLSIIGLPFLCLIISLARGAYLKESADRTLAIPILIGGTLGYMISMSAVIFLG